MYLYLSSVYVVWLLFGWYFSWLLKIQICGIDKSDPPMLYISYLCGLSHQWSWAFILKTASVLCRGGHMKRVLAGDPFYQSTLANEQLSLFTISIIMPLSNMLNHFVFPFLSIAPPSYSVCLTWCTFMVLHGLCNLFLHAKCLCMLIDVYSFELVPTATKQNVIVCKQQNDTRK